MVMYETEERLAMAPSEGKPEDSPGGAPQAACCAGAGAGGAPAQPALAQGHPPQRTERRRALAVDRQVRRMYLVVWGLSVLLVALFGALAVLLLWFGEAGAPPASVPLFAGIALVSLLLVAIALGLGVYATLHVHRAVGAAYHIERALRELVERAGRERQGQHGAPAAAHGGAPGPAAALALRPADYLQGVAEQINVLAQHLEHAGGRNGGRARS
ncbi:MAG: hypothetical protein KatS3mg102_0558 [Planctomycetota bacterium]|nr:MAG: hypothetical protein KatS3mg102_0558 [Planctomycetota bacterium]